MPRKKAKGLQKLSTRQLLARYDRAERHYMKSFARDGANHRGRLIPDPVKRHELRQMEMEIQRRTRLHDPQIMRQAARRLRSARPLSAREKAASKAINATAASAGKAVRNLEATARTVDVTAEGRQHGFGAVAHISPLTAIPKSEQKEQKVQLSEREQKIWTVIQRGSKGPIYCRELENAGLKPRRTKFWKDCPGNYLAAYRDSRWRKRVQDEKSRIARKGKLAKTLAGE
jgi:hypothetical protein